jgi:hypothetical protein
MSGSASRSPRLRDIFLGITAVVAAIIALINLGAVVKFVGAGLMVLPSALGIVERVGPREVFVYDLSTSPTSVGIGQPGRYAVYAYDYDLLTMSDEMQVAKAAPWITLKSEVTGEKVPVAFVSRGLRLYDTYLAKGRPVLSFVITRPGAYVMLHPAKPSRISIVRDYVTGKERTLTAAMSVQIAAIVLPLLFIFGRRHLARRSARKAAQRRKREENDAFWRDRAQEPHKWQRPE